MVRLLRQHGVAGFVALGLCGAAGAAGGGDGLRITHPNGASITVEGIEPAADSIIVSAAIANPSDREIRLNKARSFVAEDGPHSIHHLNPPPDNPELLIPPRRTVNAELVFLGPLSPGARSLGLSTNVGIGTTDNPFDNLPVFHASLPIETKASTDISVLAGHPNGTTLAAGPARTIGTNCYLKLTAINGNERAIVLNQRGGLVLVSAAGAVAPLRAPSENSELVVPPGDRLDADLVFDCRKIEAAETVTLAVNSGSTGTTDNPYDTAPLFNLKIPVRHSADEVGQAGMSRADVSPIKRSRLAVPADATETSSAPDAASPGNRSAGASEPSPPRPGPPKPPKPQSHELGIAHPSPPSGEPGATPQPGRAIAELEAAVHATRVDGGVRAILPADTLFGVAGDTLQHDAEPLLTDLADLVSSVHPRQVVIAGHTDSSGSDEANLVLSEHRADAVKDWLAARLPKAEVRLTARGYGRTRPIAPNHKADGSDNPTGREQNRRIEVILKR